MLRADGRYAEALPPAILALELTEKALGRRSSGHSVVVSHALARASSDVSGLLQRALPLFQPGLAGVRENMTVTDARARTGVRMADVAGAPARPGPVFRGHATDAESSLAIALKKASTAPYTARWCITRWQSWLPCLKPWVAIRRGLAACISGLWTSPCRSMGPRHLRSRALPWAIWPMRFRCSDDYAEALPVQQRAVEIGRKHFNGAEPSGAGQSANQ